MNKDSEWREHGTLWELEHAKCWRRCESRAAVGARPWGAKTAKVRSTDFIHGYWGATENFNPERYMDRQYGGSTRGSETNVETPGKKER